MSVYPRREEHGPGDGGSPGTGQSFQHDWAASWRRIDWEIVRSLVVREAWVTLRSRAWTRLLASCAFGSALLALLPAIYRTGPGHWSRPTGPEWLGAWSYLTGIGLLVALAGWTRRRLVRELRAGTLGEVLVTGSSPVDILVAKALATTALAFLLALAVLPACILAAAAGGEGLPAILRLLVTLTLLACLGLCLGLEAAFHAGGSALSALVWVLFYTGMLLAALARLAGWKGSYTPGRLMLEFSPLSTAFGDHTERWPAGSLALVALLLSLTYLNQRLLSAEWGHAAERAGEAPPRAGLIGPAPVPRAWDAGTGVLQGLRCFEERCGFGVRVPAQLFAVTGVLTLGTAAVFLFRGWDVAVMPVFALFLWAAAAIAAHNGCAPVARDRETGRWEDLALLPASDRELATGKLRAGALAWWPAALPALGAVALAVRTPAPVRLWALATLLVLPPAALLIGALIAARTRAAGEAHWRVWCLFTGLPLLLSLGAIAGVQLHWAAVLSPVFGVLDASLSGAAAPAVWIGTALYAAAGLASACALSTRLRAWVAD